MGVKNMRRMIMIMVMVLEEGILFFIKDGLIIRRVGYSSGLMFLWMKDRSRIFLMDMVSILRSFILAFLDDGYSFIMFHFGLAG